MRETTFQQLINEGLLEIGDGYRAQNNELGGTGPIFLRAGHVTDTHIDFKDVEHFHADLTEKVRSKMSRVDDTIITTKGNSTGRTSFVTERLPPFVYSPHLSYWRSRDPTKLYSGFLRYWSQGTEFIEQLSAMKTSTDMAPYLSLTDQRRLKIKLPPLTDQKAISMALGALDEKIELNRRMNTTLEAMARALFQSWFVDFDPVRAKLDGQTPSGIDPGTTALFPDNFQESRIGPIPNGWEARPLEEMIEIVKGRSYRSSELDESRTALVTLKSFLRGGGYRTDGLKPFTGEFKTNQKVRPGDLVVALTDVTQAADVIGKPALVRSDARFHTLVASLDVGIVRSKSENASLPFLYCLFLTSDFQAHTYSHVTGTTVLHLNATAIPKFVCVIPPVGISKLFAKRADPIFRLIDENANQSSTLTALRDLLLPNLLNGEITVTLSR